MDFFDELIDKLQKEAAVNGSFTIAPDQWEIFLDPSKAEKKISENVEPADIAVPTETQTAEAEAVFSSSAKDFLNLEQLQQEISQCSVCPLAKVRKNPALSRGNIRAALMIVIENPSLPDDEENKIFVGEVGILLDKMLLAMGLKREDCYITSIVKCRTPGNRPVSPEEVAVCSERFFARELQLVRPECILAFGAGFAKNILHREGTISTLRGQFDSYDGIPVMSTFNPAYLLRQPSAKKTVWGDLQMVMKALGMKV